MRDVAVDGVHARSHINDVRIGRRQRQRSDRWRGLSVENRFPRHSAIRRLPHSSAIRAQVINGRASRHARHPIHLSRAKRPDHPPLHLRIQRRRNFLRPCRPARAKNHQDSLYEKKGCAIPTDRFQHESLRLQTRQRLGSTRIPGTRISRSSAVTSVKSYTFAVATKSRSPGSL